MSILQALKQFLPVSSRSFHAHYRDSLDQYRAVMKQLDRIYERIEIADRGINMNIDFKFEDRTLPRIQELKDDLHAHDSHMKMFAWEQYRQEGESLFDAKKRFFCTLPPATGGMRLLQLGCAQLLHEFDALCRAHGLDYWLAFGTLLGAVRHGGFIPWDDDIDVGMMRDDAEKLIDFLESDASRYRVTLVYDRYVHCRQLRFRYADDAVPCFVDIFLYDWAPTQDMDACRLHREARKNMVEAMESDPDLAFWNDTPYCSSEVVESQAIQGYFDECLSSVTDAGYICDREHADGIIWSIDNLDDGKQRWFTYQRSTVFPTTAMKFEGFELAVPSDWDNMLKSRYGDYLSLPSNMFTHFEHVDHDSLETSVTSDAIRSILRGVGDGEAR